MADSKFPNPKAEEVLREYAVKSGLSNIKLSVKPGSAKGDNFVGVVFKVKIEGIKNGRQISQDVIVKAAPVEQAARQSLPLRDMFLREIYAYTDVFPIFQRVQDEAAIEESNQVIFPNLLSVNTEDFNELLVMEDLSILNYKMHEPKIEPIDMRHVALSLRMLAKLHGISYVLRKESPTVFNRVINNIPEVLFAHKNEGVQMYLKTSVEKAINTLIESPHIEYLKRFGKNHFETIVDTLRPNKYSVICHGDYWKNNTLYKYSKNGRPTSIIPLDYQMLRYSSPATDILYLLFLCTSKELRDEKYFQMLDIYHEALGEFLEHFAMKIEQVFPKEEFLNEVQRVGSYAMAMAVCVLVFLTTTGDELSDAAAAVNDGVKIDEEGASFKLYKTRIGCVLEDCVKYGYLK